MRNIAPRDASLLEALELREWLESLVYVIDQGDRTRVQRRVEGSFLIIGAELGDVERSIIVGREDRSTFFDSFAESISDLVSHTGMDDHRPTAEIDCCDGAVEPFEVSF